MAAHVAGSLLAPDAGMREAAPVNGQDIRPGDLYALAASVPGKPLRPVTALRTAGPFLIYAGPSGAEWAADIRRVAGRWSAHTEAATAAEAAARALQQNLACEATGIVEAGYCRFLVRVTLTTAQARRTVESLRGAP
jgi:hypothetical protein